MVGEFARKEGLVCVWWDFAIVVDDVVGECGWGFECVGKFGKDCGEVGEVGDKLEMRLSKLRAFNLIWGSETMGACWL